MRNTTSFEKETFMSNLSVVGNQSSLINNITRLNTTKGGKHIQFYIRLS